MKKISQLSIVLIALVAITMGCRPETVDPNANGGAPNLKGAVDNPHPVLAPTCSSPKTFSLVSEDGSTTVNRCFGPANQGFPSIACANNAPAWGSVSILNGVDEVALNFELAPTWFVQTEATKMGAESAFNFNGQGFPVIDNGWNARTINPVVGKWQLRVGMNTTGNNFNVAIKLVVVKLSIQGQVVPGSTTTLWLRSTPPINVATSPYLGLYKRTYCPQQWPAEQTIAQSVGQNGCATLQPVIANPVGQVEYEWSTNAATPGITVCPSNNTSYTVKVSDDSGPRAALRYNVTVGNGGGNGSGGNGGGNGSGGNGNGGSGSGSGNGHGH